MHLRCTTYVQPQYQVIVVVYSFGMVFNTTFNNISVISLRLVLIVEETGVPGENHRHNVISSTPRHERGSNSQLKW